MRASNFRFQNCQREGELISNVFFFRILIPMRVYIHALSNLLLTKSIYSEKRISLELIDYDPELGIWYEYLNEMRSQVHINMTL